MEAAASRVLRVGIRVYLVVVDIRIVDCHMSWEVPGPPNLLYSYIPAEASVQYNHQLHQFYYFKFGFVTEASCRMSGLI